jgi:hypothetical protein
MTITWCLTHLVSGSSLQTKCYFALVLDASWGENDEPACELVEAKVEL